MALRRLVGASGIQRVTFPARTLGRDGWASLEMSGWTEALGDKNKPGSWYSNSLTGNVYRPRDQTDFPHKVRFPKEHTGLYGLTVQPFWHRKLTGLCLDILETVQQGMPEGWPQRVGAEVYAENILELLEEVDESDWKLFEDRLKFGPVEVVEQMLEELYTNATLQARAKSWETRVDALSDRSADDLYGRSYNIYTYGIPEYDEILSDDEKTWVKAADEEVVAALHEKTAEVVYQTAAPTELDLKAKILERRKRRLTEPAAPETSFGDTGSIL